MPIECSGISAKNALLALGYSVGAAALITAIVLTVLKAKVNLQAGLYAAGGGTLLATGLAQFCTRGVKASLSKRK